MIKKKNILLSIVMPVFNNSAYIKETIDSILKFPEEVEIIISNDFSSDSTEDIIKNYSSKQIKYVNTNKALGTEKNWINALKLSSGDYVYILAGDDYVSENFIEEAIEFIKHYEPEIIIVPIRAFDDNSGSTLEKVSCPSSPIPNEALCNCNKQSKSLIKNFNHDQLILSIFKRTSLIKSIPPIHYSSHCFFWYWMYAVFYNSCPMYLERSFLNKRYNRLHNTHYWKDRKTTFSFIKKSRFLLLIADLLNSLAISIKLKSPMAFYDLIIRSRSFYEYPKKGLFGKMNEAYGFAWTRGPILLEILLYPFIFIFRKIVNHD